MPLQGQTGDAMKIRTSCTLALFGVMACIASSTIHAQSPPAQSPEAATGAAISPELIARVQAVIDADTPRLLELFKDLHRNPELAFTETRTADIVVRELKAR